MYNAHRGLVPQPNNRLTELLDQVRAEFDNQTGRAGEYEHQITNQVSEMNSFRDKLYELEVKHSQIKEKYEAEIRRLQHELDMRGGQPMQSHLGGPPPHAGPSQQPPALGHGPSNLFVGIMANPGGQGGPGLPPHQDQQQPPPQHPLPQQPPGSQQQGPPPSQPPGPFQGYQPNASMNGYGNSQPPPTTASPGSGRGKPSYRGPPNPATPQTQQASYPGLAQSPQVGRPTPSNQLQGPPTTRVGNCLADLEPDKLPAELKREGQDWFAVFNPEVPRVLDVDLVHHLVHDSVVCCVRFSLDGKYVATGCNRSAQIFDVHSGQQVAVLTDDSVDKDGDLYIRSVCFSPDGRFLATGAEDKLIRVWDIASRRIRHTFAGHEQDIYSLDFAHNGRHIASGSGDKTVRVWDIETGAPLATYQIEDGVTTVAISPNGMFVAAGSLDKSVRVWDMNKGTIIERLEGIEGHKDSVYSVAFSPNGRDLVSGSLDKTIKMWELGTPSRLPPTAPPMTGKCVRTFEGHKDFVLSVCLTPDGQWVMSGSKDRGVQFWDPQTGNAQMMLQGHKNSVISVAPSPTGNLFATGSGDMKARIWRYGPVQRR